MDCKTCLKNKNCIIRNLLIQKPNFDEKQYVCKFEITNLLSQDL